MNKIMKYDLYRWKGDTSFKTFISTYLFNPKYKFVYFKRKCEQNRNNKLRYILYRMIYGRYIIKYGVDIGAKVEIGPGFILRHLGGIAIRNEVVIGHDVEILQGVTIGYERRGKRKGSPNIGNYVWIGSNSVIVGDIKVGNNVLIAPNTFVNFDVPDNSIVIGSPGKIIHSEDAVKGYMDNTIPFELFS